MQHGGMYFTAYHLSEVDCGIRNCVLDFAIFVILRLMPPRFICIFIFIRSEERQVCEVIRNFGRLSKGYINIIRCTYNTGASVNYLIIFSCPKTSALERGLIVKYRIKLRYHRIVRRFLKYS